ncbi:hypothetical protein TCDM_12486 [Trypanosoma cruzi Dm28c]|uniref:Uncharacterized protein n=1 Tax=Trypanosoma cruzi Dm28c TaxID=1416333 RepID=V5ARJ9_TRYCR|nr:hypothetical protein TCDM_12486 [Trypanosoma cruzi Dm28c]
MRHLPTLRQACTHPADHKKPSVSVVPSLPHCGDRPASASAGTSSRREHRNSLSTSERRIDVLLSNLRQSALVRPQYDGTCPTCSVWRYNSLRGPPMRMPQWRHRPPNRRLKCRSLPKMPSMPAGKTRRKHNAGTRDGPGFSATASSRTPRAADSTAEHGRLRLIHCGNALVVGNRDCDCVGLPQPVCDGILATFVRTALALLTLYCSSRQQKQDKKLLFDGYWLHFPWNNNPRGVRGSPFFIVTLP